ncbi:MAG TPA: hypothetical protein VM537_01095 [Anaerolineae bacterium]|nr:hypothetical protein [Anaerolineae bacterium]
MSDARRVDWRKVTVEELYQDLIRQYPRASILDGEHAARWAHDVIKEAMLSEREACAKVCDTHADDYLAQAKWMEQKCPHTADMARAQHLTALADAAAIRARTGEEEVVR